MSTIDELINKERSGSKFIQDGSFKVRRPDWPPANYFLPYFKTYGNSYWHGIDEDKDATNVSVTDDFEIYEEPKPKVKHWLWTYREQVRFCSYNPGKWIQIPGSEVEM